MQHWSSDICQSTSPWNSPAPSGRASAAWRDSICITETLRVKPLFCPCRRTESWVSHRSTGGACSSEEDRSPRRSTWPCPTYSRATRGCTCVSWATQRSPTCSSVTIRFLCSFTVKVDGFNVQLLQFRPSPLFIINDWCRFVLQGDRVTALPPTSLWCWPSLQHQDFLQLLSFGWPQTNVWVLTIF